MNYKCFSTKYSPSICTWMGIFSPPILICLPFHLSALLPSTSPAGDALVAGGFLLWTKAGHRGTISDSSYKLVHYCLALDSSCTPAHPSIHPSIPNCTLSLFPAPCHSSTCLKRSTFSMQFTHMTTITNNTLLAVVLRAIRNHGCVSLGLDWQLVSPITKLKTEVWSQLRD